MKELEERESEEHMKKRMEADHLHHVYEDEKQKQRMRNSNLVARTNYKNAVNINFCCWNQKTKAPKIIFWILDWTKRSREK